MAQDPPITGHSSNPDQADRALRGGWLPWFRAEEFADFPALVRAMPPACLAHQGREVYDDPVRYRDAAGQKRRKQMPITSPVRSEQRESGRFARLGA